MSGKSQGKVREKSGNFLRSQGKSLILSKSVKSQGILFSGLLFISFLQDFEMHFLSEKMKSTLQSKQSDQFQTLRLTYVVVVVSGFRCEWFLPNTFFLFPRKAEKVWNWREKCRWAAKKTKANLNIDCFSLIKGQWKLFKGQGKVREFLTFCWVATLY